MEEFGNSGLWYFVRRRKRKKKAAEVIREDEVEEFSKRKEKEVAAKRKSREGRNNIIKDQQRKEQRNRNYLKYTSKNNRVGRRHLSDKRNKPKNQNGGTKPLSRATKQNIYHSDSDCSSEWLSECEYETTKYVLECFKNPECFRYLSCDKNFMSNYNDVYFSDYYSNDSSNSGWSGVMSSISDFLQ